MKSDALSLIVISWTCDPELALGHGLWFLRYARIPTPKMIKKKVE